MADDVRILIVASDPLARAGLAMLLSEQPGCAVAGQVAGDTDMAAALTTYRPDVVLWDLGWDASPNLERLAEQAADLSPVVALLPDDTYATDAWATGVRGLLLREAAATVIVAALRSAVQGLAVLDLALAAAVLRTRDRPPALTVEALTPREQEVLQLLAEGLPNKAIAHRLGISEHTVKFHVNTILGKLDAQSRTEAVTRAARLGLILL
ncbi:MAG: response regulator transcription factor [Anaerolineae bacterium]|nr:response regulator transcription factor [Anaerolineae bacterium]